MDLFPRLSADGVWGMLAARSERAQWSKVAEPLSHTGGGHEPGPTNRSGHWIVRCAQSVQSGTQDFPVGTLRDGAAESLLPRRL